jgi:PBSX family phage terminase large subunit
MSITENKVVNANKWQSIVWNDTHRYIVLACGRRSGKSFYSALKIAQFVQSHPKSIVYYVAPTYKQSKSIMWNMLKDIIPRHWIKRSTEEPPRIEMVNGARIELKGADENPDSLRGVKIDYLICDEVAYFRNWQTVWGKVLQPTLLDSKGNALFISSPQGYNHFYDMFMKGFEKNTDDKSEWSSYKFTTYDNEYIDSVEIDKLRHEMDEDSFQQEHMAEFKKYTGLVLKYFSREKHYIPPIEFTDNFTYYRGIDFGWARPSAVPFVAVSPDGKVYVYDLIYQAGLLAPDLGLLVKQKSVGRHFTGTWADSAQQADIKQLQDFGIQVTSVKKTASGSPIKGESFTMYKVRKLNELIKANKLFIFNHLSEALQEIENWQYKEVREGQEIKEIPAKINDHFIDALAYVIVSLPTYTESTYSEQTSQLIVPDWAENVPSWSSMPKWYRNN